MSKYPELADPEIWTPRMKHIHRRAMVLGLLFGSIISGCMIGIVDIVWKLL